MVATIKDQVLAQAFPIKAGPGNSYKFMKRHVSKVGPSPSARPSASPSARAAAACTGIPRAPGAQALWKRVQVVRAR